MPIPARVQPIVPRRFASEFTRGAGEEVTKGSHTVNAPNIAGLQQAPLLLGVDISSSIINYTGVAAGVSTALTTTFIFPALGAQNPPVGYQLIAHATVNVNHQISGLAISSQFLAIYAVTGEGRQVAGPVFPVNTSFKSFGGKLTGTGIAVTATSSGTIYCTAQVQLLLYPQDTIANTNVQSAQSGAPSPVGGTSGGGTPGPGQPPDPRVPGGGKGGVPR